MNNPQMLAVVRVDSFNLKGSMCVIGLFGIITIISYFNELNKAGLLQRGVVPRPLPNYLNRKRTERSLNHGALIEKDGDMHQLGLEILQVKRADGTSGAHSQDSVGKAINIRLRLGRNSSYEKFNNSLVPVYNHRNALPNFYASLNLTDQPITLHRNKLPLQNSSLWTNVTSVTQRAVGLHQKYNEAVLVYVYQHEPATHMVRDCLKNISSQEGLQANNLPINRDFRKQWTSLPKHRRNAFQVLYGGLTFGVCETFSRPCSYFTLASHPLDRLAALYNMCRPPTNITLRNLCRLNNADLRRSTFKQFILAQGSSLFEKLVYYAKHCRLIGEDEVCLQGARTSFVLSEEETNNHLQHILQHLQDWFGVVGLVDHLQQSLSMLQEVYGHSFTNCDHQKKLSHLKVPHRAAGKRSKDINHKKGKNSGGDHRNKTNEQNSQNLGSAQPSSRGVSRDHQDHITTLPVPSGDYSLHPKHMLSPERHRRLLKDPEISHAIHADMAIYTRLVDIFKMQVKVRQQLAEYREASRWLQVQHRIMKQHKARPEEQELNGQKTKGTGKAAPRGKSVPEHTLSEGNHKVSRSDNGKSKNNHARVKEKKNKKRNTDVQEKNEKNALLQGKEQKNSEKSNMAAGSSKLGFYQGQKGSNTSKIKDKKRENELKRKLLKQLHVALDQMAQQNLSALDLSDSHAEGVRPGTVEKANSVALRHLPPPFLKSKQVKEYRQSNVTQTTREKQEHKYSQNHKKQPKRASRIVKPDEGHH